MPAEILLPTAYLPPVVYFSLIAGSDKVFIEREENYIKQTYRNRCTIVTANGRINLSVPVRKGNTLKTAIKDAEIDYSKRWQQVHLRAISSAYGRSPYFFFYYPDFEKIILKKLRFLLDLNDELLIQCLKILKIDTPVLFTNSFRDPGICNYDFRYKLLPEIDLKPYIQVFQQEKFVAGLSIIDLIFNTGPDSVIYLRQGKLNFF